MKYIKFFLPIILLTVPTHVLAGSTGLDLLRGCTAAVKSIEGQDLSPEEYFEMIYWTGFLAGFNDANIVTHYETQKPPYCPPVEGIQSEQLIRIVYKYLKNHPKDLHQNARVCVLLAFRDAFFMQEIEPKQSLQRTR